MRSSSGPAWMRSGGTETVTTSGLVNSGPEPSAFMRKRGWGKSRKRVPVPAMRASSCRDMGALLERVDDTPGSPGDGPLIPTSGAQRVLREHQGSGRAGEPAEAGGNDEVVPGVPPAPAVNREGAGAGEVVARLARHRDVAHLGVAQALRRPTTDHGRGADPGAHRHVDEGREPT